MEPMLSTMLQLSCLRRLLLKSFRNCCWSRGSLRWGQLRCRAQERFTSVPAVRYSCTIIVRFLQKLKICISRGRTAAFITDYLQGSEANDSLMKLATQYHLENGQPQRTKFIARKQSYHGNTLGSLSLSHSKFQKRHPKTSY